MMMIIEIVITDCHPHRHQRHPLELLLSSLISKKHQPIQAAHFYMTQHTLYEVNNRLNLKY